MLLLDFSVPSLLLRVRSRALLSLACAVLFGVAAVVATASDAEARGRGGFGGFGGGRSPGGGSFGGGRSLSAPRAPSFNAPRVPATPRHFSKPTVRDIKKTPDALSSKKIIKPPTETFKGLPKGDVAPTALKPGKGAVPPLGST